jgi:hypothetical protein
LFTDLQGQLARGHQNQRTGSRFCLLHQLVHHGNQEGKSLACAGLGRGDNVFAVGGVWYGCHLDFSWSYEFGRTEAIQ